MDRACNNLLRNLGDLLRGQWLNLVCFCLTLLWESWHLKLFVLFGPFFDGAHSLVFVVSLVVIVAVVVVISGKACKFVIDDCRVDRKSIA